MECKSAMSRWTKLKHCKHALYTLTLNAANKHTQYILLSLSLTHSLTNHTVTSPVHTSKLGQFPPSNRDIAFNTFNGKEEREKKRGVDPH